MENDNFKFMGYILACLPYLIQLLLIIHCIKTGRSGWLWLLVFLPYIGGIAYIILNVIPDIQDSGKLQRAGDSIFDKLNPNKKIAELENLVRKQNTIVNIVALADAYLEDGNFEKSLELYKSCLTGPYEHDEDIEFKVVKAYFKAGKFDEAKNALEEFKKNHKISNAEQSLLEMKINNDYEKLADIFANTGNFEIGYELAKHYRDCEDFESIEKIIAEMQEYRKDYPQMRKGQNNSYYNMTKSLMR